MKTNIQMTAGGIGIVVALIGLAIIWWKFGDKIKGFFTQTINPLSDKNAAYTSANSIVQALSGDNTATVGTKVFDIVQTTQNFFKGLWTGNTENYPTDAATISVCQASKDKGDNLIPSCQWLDDNGYLK